MGFSDFLCDLIDNCFDSLEEKVDNSFNTLDKIVNPKEHKKDTITLGDFKKNHEIIVPNRDLPHIPIDKSKLGMVIDNFEDSIKLGLFRRLKSDDDMPSLGDHIFVQRSVYTHHGIYIGNGQVIHYLSDMIKVDNIDIFKDGATLCVMSTKASPTKYTSNEIVGRAYSRVGEDKYNLIFNNCEHFARWCRNND